MKYEILDISGDIGLKAYGSSLSDSFVNAAIGMYSLITDLDKIQCKEQITLNIESESIESLLVNYLNELIFHFDAYGFIGRKIVITEFTDNKLNAKVLGDYFDSDKHSRGLLIKAATYHNLKIYEVGDLFTIEVIFDI